MWAVLVVAAIGASGILFTSGRVWLRLFAARPAPFPAITADVTGRSLFAALPGLAVVALLIAVLVAVSGGRARVMLGAMLALSGVACAWYGGRGLGSPVPGRLAELLPRRSATDPVAIRADQVSGWATVTIVLAVLVVLAGLVVIVRGSHWPGALPTRYDSPADAAKSDDPWRSMDRGEDPTIADR